MSQGVSKFVSSQGAIATKISSSCRASFGRGAAGLPACSRISWYTRPSTAKADLRSNSAQAQHPISFSSMFGGAARRSKSPCVVAISVIMRDRGSATVYGPTQNTSAKNCGDPFADRLLVNRQASASHAFSGGRVPSTRSSSGLILLGLARSG